MKQDNPFREAIDESLAGVRFNANDERNVLRAVRSRAQGAPRARRRRFRPDFALAMTLAVLVAAPLSLMLIRSQRPRVVSVANSGVTPNPAAISGEIASPIPVETADSAQSEVILAARECFEAQCDTSVFSFEEYAVSVDEQPQQDGMTRYAVTMTCVYDNGCRFTALVQMPGATVVAYSTPELATVPTFFDAESDEVRSWYDRYGAYPFTWDAQTQVEFSRRYEGAAIRLPRDGELSAEQAVSLAKQALEGDEAGAAFAEIHAYPMLYAERTSADGRARYVVTCFAQPVSDALSDPCAVVTLFADSGEVESVRTQSASGLDAMM